MEKVKVKKLSIYRDGGTTHYVDSQGKDYYKDGRIGSSTKGKIFSSYPDKKSLGFPLDVELEEVKEF